MKIKLTPRKTRCIRMSDELWDAIGEQSEAEGRSRSNWLETAAIAKLPKRKAKKASRLENMPKGYQIEPSKSDPAFGKMIDS